MAGDSAEFMVTLDEAYIYLDYCNGKRRICYVKHEENMWEIWLVEVSESFPTEFMIVGIITEKGVLP